VELGGDPARVVTGTNIGDLDFYRGRVARARAADGYMAAKGQRRRCVLLFAGRIVRSKGVIDLVDACGALKHIPDWELRLAGAGPDAGELQSRTAYFGIQDRVTLLGFCDRVQLAHEFALADVLVLPTALDRFSLVIGEALASGLYVVGSSRDGAVYDLLKEGINGTIVEPGRSDDLAKVLARVVRDSPYDRNAISDSVAHLNPRTYAAQICQAAELALSAKR
jgi:glycosyltransferase involved in cell wall biosynthesis